MDRDNSTAPATNTPAPRKPVSRRTTVIGVEPAAA
jgi:hypothetical protein